MARRAATAAHGTRDSRDEQHGRAYIFGWRCFLAFVALTPLVIGTLPPQFGSLALFQAYDPASLPKAVVFLVLTGVSLAALCISVVRGEARMRWHPVLWVLVALVAWAGVSTLLSASPAFSVWGAYKRNEGLVAILGYGLVAFLAMQYVRSARQLREVMVAAAASGSLVAAYALLQFLGFDPIPWTGEVSRVLSTFGNADMLGTYLVFPLAMALGLALSAPRGWVSYGWSAAAALVGAALWATATRGAWLGALVMVVCLVLLGWSRVRQASSRQRLIAGGLAIALVVVAFVAIVAIRPRSAGGAEGLAQVLARLSNGRSVIWLTGLRGWLAHPITGWGPDGFGRAFESAVRADWYAVAPTATTVDTAHNVLIQALVGLGIPGLALMAWALVRTAIESFRGLHAAEQGRTRLLVVSVWAAFVGMLVALSFAVTTPGVSVSLWLMAGVLLAPTAQPVPAMPKSILAAAGALGIALTLWAGSWLVADVFAGWAWQHDAGPAQVSALESAVRLNPLSQTYRQLLGRALVDEALAQQKAGGSRQAVESTLRSALAAYDAALRADKGDLSVRIDFSRVLIEFAAAYPGGDSAQRAVSVALQARDLAPLDARALVTLARAYEAAGRNDEAQATARLARKVAPAYSMQTLGSLGLEDGVTP